MHRIVLTIIGLVVALVHISAQDDPQNRMEIGAGVGMVSYEGDFNGNVLKNMQPMASLLWRYNFDPYKDLRLSASYGNRKGSSADVKTYYPDARITEYEIERRHYDVKLSNRLELKFNRNFTLIGIDD